MYKNDNAILEEAKAIGCINRFEKANAIKINGGSWGGAV